VLGQQHYAAAVVPSTVTSTPTPSPGCEAQMSDWPKRAPDVPPGWIAIPKDALLRLTGQAAASETEIATVRDPDAYRHYRVQRMFQDMAIDLQARHEPFLRSIDLGQGITAQRAEVTLIDPAYIDFRKRLTAEQRVAEASENKARAMTPTAATPKPEGTDGTG
jgi:hypothetical protein